MPEPADTNAVSSPPVGSRGGDRPSHTSSQEYASCFPLAWYREFLQRIRDLEIVTLTYRDLFQNSDDWDYRSCYQREFEHWHQHIRSRDRIYLLIQHDVDFVPSFAKRMVALEAEYGVRSNIFLFVSRSNEHPEGSPYDDSPYDVDHSFFQKAAAEGFVVSYHQNALAVGGADMQAAMERFRSDVAELRCRYRIEFFCPHGGPGRTVDGRMAYNYDVPIPQELEGSVRWVYNRYGPRFSGRWSDGGLRKLDDPGHLDGLNLVDGFLRRLAPGRRYFALIHPQLWGCHVNMQYNPLLARRPWYQEVCRRYGSGGTA